MPIPPRPRAGDHAPRQEAKPVPVKDKPADRFLETLAPEMAVGVPMKDANRSLIGLQLGSHKILALLGAGGMGVVYRAHDERLDRDVALKVLPAAMLADESARRRFRREALTLSRLNHPGIITIHEIGDYEGGLFLVMELVSGKTLRELALRHKSLDPLAVARFGTQIAEALEAAHVQGVVHGDMKPENVMVQPDGRVKLLDFGIARRLVVETLTSLAPSMTGVGQPDEELAGTLGYMAPEQLRGESLDARADLFALGVIFYELTVGHRPFLGPTATALMGQVLHEEPLPMQNAIPGTPLEFCRIVHRLLQKDRETRYQTAREVQADLTNLERDLQIGVMSPASSAGKRTVAVLPFKLLTPNPEDEYLSVALADAVINALGSSRELFVRPTSTIERYVKQGIDPLLAARELNVQLVVHGSIQKVGGRLRVHVQALDPSDGRSLHTAKHDADLSSLFSLQDQLAEGLARALGADEASRNKAPAVAPPTKDPRAYELYLRAAERLARLNRWDTRTAVEMLDQAVKLDPRFAEAWARLAEALLLLATTLEPNPAWFRRAEQAARKALTLDPQNAAGHCARGRCLWTPMQAFKNRAALRAFSRALELNPGYHPARTWRCLIFLHVGLHDQAHAGLVEALRVYPDDAFVLAFTGLAAMYRKDYAEADEFYGRALTVDPANLWGNMNYPSVLLYSGQLGIAAERIRQSKQVVGDDGWLLGCEALLWSKQGEQRRAEQILTRAIRSGKTLLHTHHLWHMAAAVYALGGKKAQAVRWLEKCTGGGLPNYPLFRDDPHFESLTGYPPFNKLMGKLKVEWENYSREYGPVNITAS